MDSTFELFTHCTRFLGLRVVLLGRFNGQGLDAEAIMYSRVDESSFVRVLLAAGRLRGAVLIGNEACELAETFEQLILDELDVSALGPHILDPDVDIEDYFD
jgi:NAD(P)H-nitrite reductase large subunit